MNFSDVLSYYSRPDVQEAMLEMARGREVAGAYKTGEFGRRPNTLVYGQDIMSMVKSGVIEFHSSIERWSNPMLIRQDNHQELRVGWDLILDIDCKTFDQGKTGTLVLMRFLKSMGVENLSVKFTGGKGWHIGIPWEAIPKQVDFKDMASQFPDIPRRVALYLKEQTKDAIAEAFMKTGPEKVAQDAGVPLGEILKGDELDPWKLLEIDPVLISPRHLFRMPYSLNRKTGLVSVPVRKEDVEHFRPEYASPGRVKVDLKYLRDWKEGEADGLFMEALDWWTRTRKKVLKKDPEKRPELKMKVKEDMFPPCMVRMLDGMEDGRKRSVFVLINFLHSLKWGWEEIEIKLMEWNQKNRPPLPDSYVSGQIKHARNKGAKMPPPNCDNPAYYKGYGMCAPDHMCKTLKNPVNYPFRLMDQKKVKKKGKKR